jgi:RimJ/RimL family protein N-acetyltransferase
MPNSFTTKISRLQTQEIPRLIECVRRCYGDSYPFSAIYDKNKLSSLLEDKLMYSVIAKLDNGEVVGHCALTYDGAQNTTPELGKMLVDPIYRGHGIAEEMVKECVEIARVTSMPGIWAECVTNHPHSQHELIVFDAKETGLFIGDIPPTLSMQGLKNFADTRMSLLTYYLPLLDQSHDIFLPLKHQNHLRELAQGLNLKRTIIHSEMIGQGKTILDVVVNSSIQTANITIQKIGDDLNTLVTNELRGMQTLKLASVYIDLPIEQAAASNAYLELEALGFFWGSWLPNYNQNKDTLRLQKIYQDVNVDEIICAREQGEAVKKYVISEWQRVSQKQ